MNETAKKLLTVKEAAAALGVSPALLYALCAARRIRHERHGLRRGAIRIPHDAIEEYRKRCTVDVGEPAEAEREVTVPDLDRKGPGINLW